MARKPLPVVNEVEESEEVSAEEKVDETVEETTEETTEAPQEREIWLLAKFNTFYNPYTQERFNVGQPKQCLKLDSLIQCQIDAGVLIVVDPPAKAE